jgi:hypothetical protein
MYQNYPINQYQNQPQMHSHQAYYQNQGQTQQEYQAPENPASNEAVPVGLTDIAEKDEYQEQDSESNNQDQSGFEEQTSVPQGQDNMSGAGYNSQH